METVKGTVGVDPFALSGDVDGNPGLAGFLPHKPGIAVYLLLATPYFTSSVLTPVMPALEAT